MCVRSVGREAVCVVGQVGGSVSRQVGVSRQLSKLCMYVVMYAGRSDM